MKKILLLSDTHSYIDDRILEYTHQADGNLARRRLLEIEVIDKLSKIKPLRGVFGNIDDTKIRLQFQKF